jgi:hypothetical protein
MVKTTIKMVDFTIFMVYIYNIKKEFKKDIKKDGLGF